MTKTKGFVDHRADYPAMQERLRKAGVLKKLVVRKNKGARGLRTSPDGAKEVALDDEDIHDLVESDEPPEGWDAFFHLNIKKDIRCQQCGEMAAEVRPFGKNHESICEACAAKDPETTELRWRALNPNG